MIDNLVSTSVFKALFRPYSNGKLVLNNFFYDNVVCNYRKYVGRIYKVSSGWKKL